MSEPPPADTAATVAAVAATASTVTPTTTDRARDTAGRSDDASESHNVSPLLPPPPAPTDATEPPAPPLPAAEPLAGSDKSPPLRTAAEQLTNGDGSLAEAHTPASASSSRPLPVEVSSQQGAVSGDVPVASAIGAPVNSIQAKPVRPAGSRSGTLDRGGGGRQHQPDDEHKYETLDHAAKPVSYSEDEGVCCSNIHSALAKRAKELVRPSYQKGDHPRDRPPVPAKPARPSVAARQHQPHQQDQHQKQSPTRPVSAGYEPIDTSRSIVPPIPGIPTTGPLKKKEAGSKCVTISGIMDSKEKKPDEFKSVQESKTSIQLKDARSRATADDAVHGAAPDVKIDVKVLSTRPQGYESIQAVQRGLVAEPTKHDEKKSLISRVKNIKVENPFKKTDENDQSDSEESKPRFMNKIFKKDKENKESGAIGASDGKEKISLSGKINKAFHREKKDSQNDSSDRNQSNEEKLTGRLGKMKFTKDGKETDATTHEIDARKILTTSKFAERQSKKPTKQSYFAGEQENTETSTENQSKEDFLTANDGQKEENDEPRAVDCSEKKLSLITRVFSRDAKEAELNNMQDSQQGKSLAEMISDFKVKVFARQEQNRESAGDGVGEGDEKKTFFERYFPPEKPTIQQIVLTEEMEPDCKRRRMGKITKFEQTKEVEGEVDSPARKLFKENIEKFASKVKEVQDIMPKNLMSRKDKDAATSGNALEKPSDESGIKHDYEVTTQVVVTRESSPAVQRCVSSSPPPNANLVVNNDDLGSLSASIDNVVRPPVDKATVFYAKVGSSEIEVKEDHYGRIQVSDKKEPIYAKPLKLLKRGFADLSKSTPTLPTHTDEPIEYIDAGELGLEQRQPIAGTGEPAKEEPTLGHHYEQLAEPEKQKRTVAEFKVRGRHGVTEVIKIETQLVKGKSLSALNEPATITTVKTFEKQKPPVPPRPQLSTPTIIGRKPGSSPTTPTSTVSIGPLAQPESFAVDDEASFGSPTAPAAPAAPTSRTSDTSGARSSVTKVAPPRPPPPTLPAASAASMCGSSTKSTPKHSLTSGLLASNSRLQAAILDTFSRFQRITPPTISVIKSVQRGPDVLEFTKTSTSAVTATSTTSTATVRPAHDASSVYCQTDVALGADLLARIERALAAGTSPGAASELLHGGPLSPSAWTGSRVVADGDRVRSQGPTFYDEPVRLRAEFADDGSDFSKRISDLQVSPPPPLPPKTGRRRWPDGRMGIGAGGRPSTSQPTTTGDVCGDAGGGLRPRQASAGESGDFDDVSGREEAGEWSSGSGDSVYYDCPLPPPDGAVAALRCVQFASEDDVRVYDRTTDESRSNSLSQNVSPPPSSFPSETSLSDLSAADAPAEILSQEQPAGNTLSAVIVDGPDENDHGAGPDENDHGAGPNGDAGADELSGASRRGRKWALERDPSLESDESDWSDRPSKMAPSPSILLKRKPLLLLARAQRRATAAGAAGSSTDTDSDTVAAGRSSKHHHQHQHQQQQATYLAPSRRRPARLVIATLSRRTTLAAVCT